MLLCIAGAGMVSAQDAVDASVSPQVYTEDRQPCSNYTPTRQPLFGDLHVHTRLSFDSFISAQKNGPDGAYRYAKGEPITLSDAESNQTVIAQISRPLDFTGVTDHAEYLGETLACQESSSLGYWWPTCMLGRSDYLWFNMFAASFFEEGNQNMGEMPSRSWMCKLPGMDCEASKAKAWDIVQQAAEKHYDRSENCSFTSFVAYEYTAHPDRSNTHRIVIFRNANVPEVLVSICDTGNYNFPDLWKRLRASCTDAGINCDVMSIPHNPNLTDGLMYSGFPT